MFRVNNRNARTRSEKCSKLTMKAVERHQWHLSSVVIVNFEHISHLILVLLNTRVNFEQIDDEWILLQKIPS